MSLTLQASTDFETPPPGPQAARLARLIDLGSQPTSFEDEQRMQHKLLLVFALAERRSDGERYLIARRFGATLHQKGALRQFLESWRGKPFTAEEASSFDLRRLLNQPALLNLVEVARGERVYCNIASVSPVPRGMPSPEPLADAELLVFDLSDRETYGALDQLSDRLREQIESSPEWRAAQAAPAPAARPAAPPPAPPQPARRSPAPAATRTPAPAAADFADSDIPF